ncbi:MAG: 50S ribosomal protein L6 [Dehalococcoidales bacterium]|jgi:large subunit ribosomal protein L6|nr:50S ribosomal protein L6 [Dehalococcoidales bacterium]
MSRIGKLPIAVPQGVTVDIQEGKVSVKGPKGELSCAVSPDMIISFEDGTITVARPSDAREHRAKHGLTRALVANMVEGVTKGFTIGLEVNGVGYRAEKTGNNLQLRIGFSHLVEVEPLPGTSFEVEKNNRITISGIDKQQVGQIAAKIRAVRPPDAYKGKGIRYVGEVVRLKPGKAGSIGKGK